MYPSETMLAQPAASSAGQLLMSAIGSKLRGLLRIGGAAGPVQADPEALKKKAIQSTKIYLRLLAREERFAEMVEIAESTREDEIAGCAVSELATKTQDQVEFLDRLARSRSHAAVFAIIALFNHGHSQRGQAIFINRLNNGELAELVASGQANLYSILDVLGWLEKNSQNWPSDLALQHFHVFWQCLGDDAKKQMKLIGQIFGDPEPGGVRYVPDSNAVPVSIKLHALTLLSNYAQAQKERALFYATRLDDDRVSHPATVSLVNIWRSELGKVPPGLEPFRMLDLNLLFHLCQISASFNWGNQLGAEQFYETYLEDHRKLEKLDPIQDKAAHSALSHRLEKSEKELVRITECRVNALQPLVSKICSLLQLPHATLASTDLDLCAAYVIGRGRVEINRGILMEDKPLSEELMSALLHEILHMEQDVLVIRMIADDIGLKFGQHSKQLEALYEKYAAGIGYAPDSMFLLAVLRLRDDEPLNDAERKRAWRLYGAAKQAKINGHQSSSVKNRLAQIEESREALSGGNYDVALLDCLRGQHGLDSLFQKGAVPAVLLDEMNSCREDLARIVNDVHALNGAPYLVRQGRKFDIISLAQEMYMSDIHMPYVGPVVVRLRALLLQILHEERKTLDKRMTEIMRTGYHEAETYEITDRVGVIVKAIRKCWFQQS